MLKGNLDIRINCAMLGNQCEMLRNSRLTCILSPDAEKVLLLVQYI